MKNAVCPFLPLDPEGIMVQYPTFVPAYQDVLDLLELTPANVLITGRAGSSKSTLIKRWLQTTQKTIAPGMGRDCA